jgi:hypothetical protein
VQYPERRADGPISAKEQTSICKQDYRALYDVDNTPTRKCHEDHWNGDETAYKADGALDKHLVYQIHT